MTTALARSKGAHRRSKRIIYWMMLPMLLLSRSRFLICTSIRSLPRWLSSFATILAILVSSLSLDLLWRVFGIRVLGIFARLRLVDRHARVVRVWESARICCHWVVGINMRGHITWMARRHSHHLGHVGRIAWISTRRRVHARGELRLHSWRRSRGLRTLSSGASPWILVLWGMVRCWPVSFRMWHVHWWSVRRIIHHLRVWSVRSVRHWWSERVVW